MKPRSAPDDVLVGDMRPTARVSTMRKKSPFASLGEAVGSECARQRAATRPSIHDVFDPQDTVSSLGDCIWGFERSGVSGVWSSVPAPLVYSGDGHGVPLTGAKELVIRPWTTGPDGGSFVNAAGRGLRR